MTNVMLPVMPDIQVLLAQWLPEPLSLALAPTTGESPRVVKDVPREIPETIVRITRAAGTNRNMFVDRPIVDIGCFSPDEDNASATALTIMNVLQLQLRGLDTGYGVVQQVTTILGPHWLPDENQLIFHYDASYEFHVHAATGS